MNQKIKNLITDNAICSLLKKTATNVTDSIVDYNLQIININLQSGQYKKPKDFSLYTCTLGDREFKHSGFIISRILAEQEPKIGDVINIKKISTSTLSHKECKIIIVKKYEYVKTNCMVNSSLINVETYEDIQKMICQNKKNGFFNSKTKKINLEESMNDIDMKSVINLSQISTFTKNICLYVKIIRKSTTKEFHNKVTNKEGKLLSLDLIDKTGFEMQATIFDETIEKYGDLLEEGNIYYIKGGYAKLNDKRFTNIKTDYRLIFDMNTQISKIIDDTIFNGKKIEILGNNNKIIKFSELKECKKNEVINSIVCVLQTFPPQKKQSRIGDVLMKKIIVGDISRLKCQMTLWKKFADLDIKENDILLLKFIRVNLYNNNICLSTIDDSNITIDPKDGLKELEEFKNFLNEGIKEDTFKFIVDLNNNKNNNINNKEDGSINTLHENKIMYINDILKSLKYGSSFSQTFTIKATILEFEHSNKNYYYGCPNKICRKKLVKNDDDWFCPGCELNIYEPNCYYTLSLRVIDLTGEHALNLFGESVSILFGIDAKNYAKLIETNNTGKLQEISNLIEYRTFYFSGKANTIEFNGRVKKQLFVYKFEQLDFNKEKNKIINEIHETLNQLDKEE